MTGSGLFDTEQKLLEKLVVKIMTNPAITLDSLSKEETALLKKAYGPGWETKVFNRHQK